MSEDMVVEIIIFSILFVGTLLVIIYDALPHEDAEKETEEPYGEYSETIESMRKESEELDVRIRETEEVKRLEEEIARKKARLAEIEGDNDDGIVPGSLTVVSTVGRNYEEGTHTPDKTRIAFEGLIAKVEADLKKEIRIGSTQSDSESR